MKLAKWLLKLNILKNVNRSVSNEKFWALRIKTAVPVAPAYAHAPLQSPGLIAYYFDNKGTIYLTKLFGRLKSRKAMVYVSTVYANCTHDLIEEKFYRPKINHDKMITLVESVESDHLLELLTPELIKPWPNTYVFTKSITEDYIRKECSKLPIGVFRPGISKFKSEKHETGRENF